MTDVRCVLRAEAVLGEGAVWDVAGQALYWVDIKGRRVHRYDPARERDEQWPVAEDVGSLAVRAAGGLLLALRSGFHVFDPATGRTTPVAAPEADRAENRFNDGKTDRQGRFWAGSMHDPETRPTGALYRLDPDLTCRRLIDGIVCSNALGWSPDARTMYHADTCARTVWAWDFDPARGEIANRRTFVQVPADAGAPDGATVDAEGFVWLAHWNGWRVTRYDPSGRIDRVIRLPVQRPTCPAFGGPGLDVLYVTSATIGLSAAERARQPWAGGLLALDPGVRGLPETRFAG
jgi:sugar lactone lactonase YvrE